MLVSFHRGDFVRHADELFDKPVSLDFTFFDPKEMEIHMRAGGFLIDDVVERDPYPEVEFPSRAGLYPCPQARYSPTIHRCPTTTRQFNPSKSPGEIADRTAERALSALAHGAIAFGLFGVTFIVTLAITGVIWLYSRRSPEVRFHAAQAGLYQCSVC